LVDERHDGGVLHDAVVGLRPVAGGGVGVAGVERVVDEPVDLGVVEAAVVAGVGAVVAAVEQRDDGGAAVVAVPVGHPAGHGDVPFPGAGPRRGDEGGAVEGAVGVGFEFGADAAGGQVSGDGPGDLRVVAA